MRKTQTISLLALTFIAFAAQAQRDREIQIPEGVTVTPDIHVATVGDHELGLDLYMPEGVANPPLLVWIHGGGWRAGSRKSVSTLAFVEAGFAMASVSYRLSPVAEFPAQSHDIKGAIRFLRANADKYSYDASRIGVLGVSAGAHLAALVGVTNGHEQLEGNIGGNLDYSSDVQAIVSYFGASNLTSILDQSTPFGLNIRVSALDTLFGGSPEDKPELAKLASPKFHVDAADPPLLLLHGDQDPQMPINQTHELHGAYKHLGLDVDFEVVHGSGHGGPGFFDEPRTAMVKSFLDKQLRQSH